MSWPRGAGSGTGAPVGSEELWELRLYVTGSSPPCLRAIENLRLVCEQYLQGRYRIDVVDLLEDPRLAVDDQILAVPTLIRRLPLPIRTVVGDLSDTDRLLAGLQLPPRNTDVP
jgi:circadian clock protein KaiB